MDSDLPQSDDPNLYEDLKKFLKNALRGYVYYDPVERLLKHIQMLTDKVSELEEKVKKLEINTQPRPRPRNLNDIYFDI